MGLFSRALNVKYTKIFINNQWCDSISGDVAPCFNPATEEKICDVAEAGLADVDKSVEAARAAFDSRAPWRTMNASARGHLLTKLANLIERDAEQIKALEIANAGKPVREIEFDLVSSIGTLRYFGGSVDKIHGDTVPADGNIFCFTRREPIGVCAEIIAWNYPLMLATWKLGPALAAGCTCVLKPSEKTPLTALHLASLIQEAGFPPGVVNVLPGGCKGPAVSEYLVAHQGVDKVSFTGSLRTGRIVQKNAAQSEITTVGTPLKRLTLELGGKSPLVVCEDITDFEGAATQAVEACMTNMGQCCCAATRTFVHDAIYDDFVNAVIKVAKERKWGDPSDPEIFHGPQIDKRQMENILRYVEVARAEGARVVVGGKRGNRKGFFVEPTVVVDVTDEMTVAKEEIFGPVMSILKYTDFDEVIRRCNDTEFGLAAGILTNNLNKATQFFQEVRAGSIWVNCFNFIMPQTPFGGYKNSGFGRELGLEAIGEYTECKTVSIAVLHKNN